MGNVTQINHATVGLLTTQTPEKNLWLDSGAMDDVAIIAVVALAVAALAVVSAVAGTVAAGRARPVPAR